MVSSPLLVVVLVFFKCQGYKQRTQHHENECLKESHQEFEKAHKNSKGNCNGCTAQATA